MATAEHIKALIRSHLNQNPEQFVTTALQVAAHEARQGHTDLAHEIRQLVDKAKTPVLVKFPGEQIDLLNLDQADVPLSVLVVNSELRSRIDRIILEFYQRAKLKSYGLTHRRKLLLAGAPGTGKTMTARVLATELKQPLYTVQMDRLVTKFMGETSAKLRQIFDRIKEAPGVYLFDEFDAIGADRSFDNDVGEMRRVLNAFLQFIENDTSDNLIIAATNNPQLLDRALFRRFDDVLQYELPGDNERSRLISNALGTFRDSKKLSLAKVVEVSAGLSPADIVRACRDAVKLAVLEDKKNVSQASLLQLLQERHSAYRA